MTRLIHRDGDMFTSDAPAQAQGVNVDGLMGAGIAPIFKRKHPAMFEEYARLCAEGVLLPGEVHAWVSPEITIFNVASQDRPGANARIEWLESSMSEALAQAEQMGFDRIAMPRIGCGIGGLDWADVEPLLERLAGEQTCDIEVWTL
jgi:O-acetyl-ADP-ribose deacetylase (regulator of RNase III)